MPARTQEEMKGLATCMDGEALCPGYAALNPRVLPSAVSWRQERRAGLGVEDGWSIYLSGCDFLLLPLADG